MKTCYVMESAVAELGHEKIALHGSYLPKISRTVGKGELFVLGMKSRETNFEKIHSHEHSPRGS